MKLNELKEFIEKNVGPEVVVYNTYGECIEGFFSPVIDTAEKSFKLLCPRFLGDVPYYVDMNDVKRVVLKGSDFRSKVSGNIQKFKIMNIEQLDALLVSTKKGMTVELFDRENKHLAYGAIEYYGDILDMWGISIVAPDPKSRRMGGIIVNTEDVRFISIFDINAIFGNGTTMDVD